MSTKLPFMRACAGWLLCAGLALLAGCGGGGGGSASTVPTTAGFPASAASVNDPNVVAIRVGSGPGRNVNIPYVTVTVCIPGGIVGTSNCKNIDNVLLDTGSTGLRLFADVVASAGLTLPPHTIGGSSTIFQCAEFLASVAWGSVKRADVVMGGMRAGSVPIQLMDTNLPSSLSGPCASEPLIAQITSSSANLTKLSANGILGVGLFTNDGQSYFNCGSPTFTCSLMSPSPAPAEQVQNPVSLFSVHNNGVVVQLPAIGAAGVGEANGFLIFGVGTHRSNNLLGNALVVPLRRNSPFFPTTYRGLRYDNSFIDSGSNGLYFEDTSGLLTPCTAADPGFYCPPTTQPRSASIALSGSNAVVNFSIANAESLFRTNSYAFSNLGGTLNRSYFAWGLPFFFGRSVYTVIEGTNAGGIAGPYYAFTN